MKLDTCIYGRLRGVIDCRSWAGRLAMLTVAATMLAGSSAASAAVPAPHWAVISQPAPTYFHPGDSSDFYEIIANNDGGAGQEGSATITDTLPVGVTVNAKTSEGVEECQEATENKQVTVTCKFSGVAVGQSLVLNININVPPTASGDLTNAIKITGGGAPDAEASNTTPVTDPSTPVPFGASLVSDVTASSGLDTQAGSHPFAFTTLLDFNVGSVNANLHCNRNSTLSCAILNTQTKDLEVALPVGFVGNPTAVPYCRQAEFELPSFDGCPASTQVGIMYLYFYGSGTAVQEAPVYNIEPPPGQPAEFGFSVSTVAHIPIFFHVRSDDDYGLTADIRDINQFDPVRIATLSIWGNPPDPIHDPLRFSKPDHCGNGGCSSHVLSPKPFLTLPSSCPGHPLSLAVAGDSWQEPKTPLPQLASATNAGLTGCEALRFNPAIRVAASTHQAGAPVGYDVDLNVPQNEEIEGLATPDVRDVEVTLPQGVAISPSAANGLTACSEAQFELRARTKGHCPGTSKIGTVRITTPLLSQPIHGALYIGEPECSPCSEKQAETGEMVRLLLEAEGAGVIIKLTGHTRIGPEGSALGQLTTTFTENPQLPFSNLHVSLEQGPSAPLVNPSVCGQNTTTAALTPWSSSTPTSIAASPVSIEGCASATFAPTLRTGATRTAHAGEFTGFVVTLSRNDGEEAFGRVGVTTPPGLLGVLKSVEQCGEAQANSGTCAVASQIGTSSITLGAGSSPLTIGGGRVYLTGPYGGKPFGLSIVTPAQAGPFVLGGNTGTGTEVVRASIAIDPHTSALTVTSDPLPQALNGIPLNIRTINVNIDRERFMFNPTNCDSMSVGGVLTSATETAAHVTFPFQATDCARLPFKPRFTVSTQGKTSKKNGASLHVKVASGAGQANIGKVKVNLPIQLPSRTSTLQKACVDSIFDANPALCRAESVVGHATAVTPLLKKPLTGPAYIVSHAGRSFPDLDIVLQGEGITLVLTGNTDIKKGVTSSTFKAIPDAPVSTFDLVLPEGPHSILAAFGNLCASKLNMPTVITGQNGAVVKQTTKIAATGCPKHVRHARKKSR